MKAKRAMTRMLAVLALASAAALALAGSALAVQVQGADYYGTGNELESGEVDVLNVGGGQGDTVFLSVERGGRLIAKNIPYALGEGITQGYGDNWTGVVTLDISGYDTSQLDGTYVIKAYSDRSDGELLYSGVIYGVYADLPDGTSRLIGTRTVSADEDASRTFVPSETLYAGGQTYKLAGAATGTGALHFPYEAYDEATTVDGVIKYVDMAGNVLTTTKIAGIPFEGEREVEIPSAIRADNGDMYRTVFFKSSVMATNPGQTSFTITCSKMSDADKTASNYYVATIKMVDENGAVIATDTVSVTGNFIYTAPTNIYKNVVGANGTSVKAYEIVGSPTVSLSASSDGVQGMSDVIEVPYKTVAADEKEVAVTFNLIDGSKRVGESGRTIGVETLTVTADEPTAMPQATVQSGDGEAYNIVGEPADYAYAFGSGAVPVVNVYYTPEGYQPPGAYDVTVNYVNFLTNEVVESATYSSDPNATGADVFQVPATFTKDGIEYVRLDGQGDTIEHSYYSGIASYTVYYRDVNDTLTAGTVINTIRVVYRDGGTATVGTGAAAPAAGTDATAEGGAAADAGAAGAGAGAGVADAVALQLDDSRTYNVLDGDGNNSTLTNEEGIDSNTERIADDENPLASGLPGSDKDNGTLGGALSSPWVIVGIVAAVVIALAVALLAIKRRKAEDAQSGTDSGGSEG